MTRHARNPLLRRRRMYVLHAYVLLLPALIQYVAWIGNKALGIAGIYLPPEVWRNIASIAFWIYFLKEYKTIKKASLLFILFCVSAATISVLIYGERQVSTERLSQLLLGVLPYYFLGGISAVEESEYEEYRNLSIFVLTVNVIYSLYYIGSGREILDDNMEFSYTILPAVLIILYCALYKGGKLNWLCAILSVAYAAVQGTRGPMLCIGIFFILYSIKKKGIKRSGIVVSILFFAGYAALKSEFFINWINALCMAIEKAGFSTRFLRLLITDNLASDNGRAFIQERLLEAIKARPVIGYGIFGDRVLSANLYNAPYSYRIGEQGAYAHNIVIEVLCQFGIFAGGGFLICFIRQIVRAYFACKLENSMILWIAIVCGFVHLFISGSYLQNPCFFFLLGVCGNINAAMKQRSKTHERAMALQCGIASH